MVLEIIKYSNRKFYIKKNKGVTKAGYITLPEIASLLRANQNLEVNVIKKTTGEDITKSVLLSLLTEGNFTEKDIYALVRAKAQYQSGLNNFPRQVREFYTSGIEL